MEKYRDKGISEMYKIFKVIYSKSPPILKDLSDENIDIDYKEYIDDVIDFKKINNTLIDEKYSSMTDIIKDIRLVFLNCYKFYGPRSDHTINSLKIEEIFENKISELDEHLKPLADIEITLNLLNIERKQNFKFKYPKGCYNSELLKCVAHCRLERLNEYHKKLYNTYTTDVDNIHILEELISWEKEIFFNDHFRYISSMWELPEIGNFVSIIFKEFDYDIVNQSEIERMFLMPKESTTMSKIMTTLLMPIKKRKSYDRIMPYNVWSERLGKKVSEWYKMYYLKRQNKVQVMQCLGIHPDFWAAVGDKNPLDEYDYCELSYFMKVWLVKGLCDYTAMKYKTVNDIIMNCNERQCTIWKNDMETEEYFIFDSMPDLRIYYYNIPHDEPSLEFLNIEETDEELKKKNALFISESSNNFHSKSRVKPNENNFKLIADSVQGLRSFIAEIDTEDSSVPDTLISALENLILKVEPNEYNLMVLNNNSKIKLFKDWKSYSERIEKEKDDELFWNKKNLRSITGLDINEVLMEKRKRKPVIKDNDIDIKCDSDEYFISDNEEIMTDYTDSEDEWGAMNQTKNKSKLPPQPSKLYEIENRLKYENKKAKRNLNNDFKDKLPEIVKENDNIKHIYKTNNTLNSYRKKLVGQKSTNPVDIKIKVLDDEVLSIDSDDDENKKHIISVENDRFVNEQSNTKKNKTEVLKDDIIVDLDDSEILTEDFSRSIISKNSAKDNKKINKQNYYTTNKPADSNLKNDIIAIEDDEQIIISDDEDDVQFISIIPRVKNSLNMNKSYTVNNNLNISNTRVSANSPIKRQVTSIISPKRPKISPSVSIIPANVHLPKGIQITMVKNPQTTIKSHFNINKRLTPKTNSHLKNNTTVNVECKIISKPNFNGEVKFYVNLPNGTLHPVSDELMNQYLKEHNNRLPDYWLVPLPLEVAKQYGFK